MTDFGKLLRKLRIDYNEVLYDMAKKLKVSPAFLSSVENGRKSAPPNWVPVIVEKYSLNSKQAKELQKAADLTTRHVRINLEKANNSKRELALAFARRFEGLNKEQRNEMLQILNTDQEGA